MEQAQAVTESSPKAYLTQNEISELLGITPQAASLFASKHELKPFRVQNKSAFAPSAVRKFLNLRGVNYPKEIISFQMLKGGSTKTSSAFNLAVRLNQYGARVLCVDLDMQGNLTDALGFEISEQPVMYHVANGEAKVQEAIQTISEGLDLIPSDFENSTLDYVITTKRLDLRKFIANILAPVRDDYDFVIIDCNPALSALNISIALASDRVIIPVNPDKFSAKGLKKTVEELERISQEYGEDVPYNLLYTLYDGREATSQRYLIEYGHQYKDRLISTVIKRNADVKNAIDQKKSIFDFKRAPAREDFDLFAREILGFRNLSKGNA